MYKEQKLQSSIIDELEKWAIEKTDNVAYHYLVDNTDQVLTLSYGQLRKKALSIAVKLKNTLNKNDRVVLLYPQGIDYICAFWACLYAGVTAVPAFPPRSKRQSPRVHSIIKDTAPKYLMTTNQQYESLKDLIQVVDANCGWLLTDDIDENDSDLWQSIVIESDDLAFLQYTSGSTGDPKGVMVSHGNLLCNEQMMQQAMQTSDQDVVVSWLPVFHDMGLIGGMLHPIYLGATCVMMSPNHFLQKPIRWLEAITNYKGSIIVSPNFALDLCVSSISDDQKNKLDLSSLQVFCNGSEPIRYESLEHFQNAFEVCGFRPQSFFPTYGMAETTLLVTGSGRDNHFVSQRVCQEALNCGKALLVKPSEKKSIELVSSGQSVCDQQELIIVDSKKLNVLEEGTVGEIVISGQHVAKGYWNRQQYSKEVFKNKIPGKSGNFLRTGDLGFILNGELYVTGRLKDTIIINGKNYYPQDIEKVVEGSHDSFRKTGCVAFSVDKEGKERVVVCQELERIACRKANVEQLQQLIKQTVWSACDLMIDDVVLLKPAGVPKTSSGKVQRQKSKQEYLSGQQKTLCDTAKKNQEPEQSSCEKPEHKINTMNQESLKNWVVNEVADMLSIPVDTIDPSQPLANYGMGSIEAVGLSGKLSDKLDKSISATIAFDCPTIDALISYLSLDHIETNDENHSLHEPIAVIAAECHFPGAENIEDFWSMLQDGKSGITEIPEQRWNTDSFFHTKGGLGKMYTKKGGFIDGVELFDNDFFDISSEEAQSLDPQQRLLLETAWKTVERANYSFEHLNGANNGVFIGISNNDYGRNTLYDINELNAYINSGNALSIAANRISYFMNWHGPSQAIDTACSSSLVAIHQACQSLRNQECSMALAGGVNLILRPELTVAFSQAQMLAPDGQCKVFDERADGYVRSEGCGLVLLKTLKDAQRDGDPIMGVIRSSAINQDGRSNGLTAPNSQAQKSVVKKALAHAGLSTNDIAYLECHGTGTSLGDPIEVNTLGKLYKNGNCTIGSVKANIGHLESAAGVAGFIKSLLCLKYRCIPKQINFNNINPAIDLGDGLSIVKENTPLQQHQKYAAVSAFSFGGSNAHVILSEVPPNKEDVNKIENLNDQILCISANSMSALKNKTQAYAELLNNTIILNDFCATSFYARSQLKERLAIVANNKQQVMRDLLEFSSTQLFDNVFVGSKQPNPKLTLILNSSNIDVFDDFQILYSCELVFKQTVDQCANMYYCNRKENESQDFFDVNNNHPVLVDWKNFVIQYSLLNMLHSKNISADVIVGHQIGDYVAACWSGAISLKGALALITARSNIIQHSQHDKGQWVIDQIALNSFKQVSSTIKYTKPQLIWLSSKTGTEITSIISDDYWMNEWETTKYEYPYLSHLLNQGMHNYLELGNSQLHSFLMSSKHKLQQSKINVFNLSLNVKHQDLVKLAAGMYVLGFDLHESFFSGQKRSSMALPLTTFNKKKFWIDSQYQNLYKPNKNIKIYTHQWVELGSLKKPRQPMECDWLILSDGGALQKNICQTLVDQSQSYQIISSDDDFTILTDGLNSQKTWMILYLWPLEKKNDSELLKFCSGHVLSNLWKVLEPAKLNHHLWCLTSGAFSLDKDNKTEVSSGVYYQGLWAYWRGLVQEFPRMKGGVIDLDSCQISASLLIDEIQCAEDERQIALRNNNRYGLRWQYHNEQKNIIKTQLNGTYIVAGALGGIGQEMVKLLICKGVKNFVFLSRSQLPAKDQWPTVTDVNIRKKIDFIKSIRSQGINVSHLSANVKNKKRLSQIFQVIEKSAYPDIKGIVYSAGVRKAEKADAMNDITFEEVVESKVKGAMHLHDLSLGLDLDMFIMCSSIASSLGAPGQVAYGAANGCLDALATMRKINGLPALSINWGPWSDKGMFIQAQQKGEQSLLETAGIVPLSSKDNMQQLSKVIDGTDAQVMIAEVDWEKYLNLYQDSSMRSIFSTFMAPNSKVYDSSFKHELSSMSYSQREKVMRETLVNELRKVLCNNESIDIEMPFDALGMDSITAIEYKNRLQKKLQMTISATVTYNHPNVSMLTNHILSDLYGFSHEDKTPSNTPKELVHKYAQDNDDRFAIVGMSCNFPGGADTPEKYWQMLLDGKDTVTEVPSNRWDVDDFYSAEQGAAGKSYSRYGAFVDGVDEFAAEFFEVSHREAKSMDPQHRMLLEVSWQAFENAGINIDSLTNQTCGVYVGIGQNDYSRKSQIKDIDTYDGTGNGFCFAAGRIAHVFGLRGPTMSIDTACSSSLMALHLACQSLKNRESDVALASGVQLMLSPETGVFLSKSGALTSGSCARIFDDKADGFLRGEGCGAVIVKRLSDAIASGDNILAEICSTATNHDGPSRGLTVPNGSAQKSLIETALSKTHINPNHVDLVEAHGTGTILGDPVEVEALMQTYTSSLRETPLEIRSVKANIGHLEAAAGIAGVIKTVLSLQHKVIPGQLHFQQGNRHIDWSSGDISVNAHNKEWPQTDHKPTAAVSAFGLSGSNVHLLLEAHECVKSQPSMNQSYPLTLLKATEKNEKTSMVFVISARSKHDLVALAESYINSSKVTMNQIKALCLKANTTRKLFKHRLAIPVINADDLYEKLNRFAHDKDQQFYGEVSVGQPAISDALVQKMPHLSDVKDGHTITEIDLKPLLTLKNDSTIDLANDIAQLAIHYPIINWQEYFGIHQLDQQQIILPNYPFERKSFWVKSVAEITDQIKINENSALEKALNQEDFDGLMTDIYQHKDFQSIEKGQMLQLLNVLKSYGDTSVTDNPIKSYTIDWEKLNGISDVKTEASATGDQWIICVPNSEMALILIEKIKSLGDQYLIISPKHNCIQGVSDQVYGCESDDLTALKMNVLQNNKNTRFIYLCDGQASLEPEDLEYNGGYTLAKILTEFLSHSSINTLGVLTTGSVEVDNGCQDLEQILQAPMNGLVKSLSMEYPDLKSQVIDVDPNLSCINLKVQHALDVICMDIDECQLALRGNNVLVPRVKPLDLLQSEENKIPEIDGNGAYLLSGGLGGLAFEMSKFLIKKGVRYLLLSTRKNSKDLNQYQHEKILQLEKMGATVTLVTLNFSDKYQVLNTINDMHQQRNIKGVVHTAGCISRCDFGDIKRDDYVQMHSAKINATMILHEASLSMPLDFFINFSSISAAFGTKQLAHYAASNAFLDGFSHYRQAQGLVAQTINWGPWAETGMLKDQQDQVDLSISGILPQSSDDYIQAFSRVMTQPSVNIILADIQWSTFVPLVGFSAMRSLFEHFKLEDSIHVDRGPTQIMLDLADCQSQLRQMMLSDFIQKQLAKVLHMDSELPSKVSGFNELGIDSIMAIDIQKRLSQAFATELSATVIFNHPTINKLSQYLLAEILEYDQGNGSRDLYDNRSEPPHSHTIEFDPIDQCEQQSTAHLIEDQQHMSEDDLIHEIAEKYKLFEEIAS